MVTALGWPWTDGVRPVRPSASRRAATARATAFRHVTDGTADTPCLAVASALQHATARYSRYSTTAATKYSTLRPPSARSSFIHAQTDPPSPTVTPHHRPLHPTTDRVTADATPTAGPFIIRDPAHMARSQPWCWSHLRPLPDAFVFYTRRRRSSRCSRVAAARCRTCPLGRPRAERVGRGRSAVQDDRGESEK